MITPAFFVCTSEKGFSFRVSSKKSGHFCACMRKTNMHIKNFFFCSSWCSKTAMLYADFLLGKNMFKLPCATTPFCIVNLNKKICPLRGHILNARFARSSLRAQVYLLYFKEFENLSVDPSAVESVIFSTERFSNSLKY